MTALERINAIYCVAVIFLSDVVSAFPANLSGVPPPINWNGGSAQVYIGFYIESLGNFEPTQMAFDVDLYLRMSWEDPRLRHSGDTAIALTNQQALEEIWLPDLYFANARTTHFHDVTVPNLGGSVFPDGTVALSRRVTMNVACNMNLKNYPMDEQTCCIRLASYANNISKVRVSWFSNNAISYNSYIDLPEMTLISMRPRYCASNTFAYPITEQITIYSEFSCLEGVVLLRRSVTYHLVQSYIPTGLIVVISWLSFWIDQAAIPARVSLSFTTLLTLSTMGAGLRYSLPPVSYAKAIDYWYGVCMLFVFAALIEFAVVNSLVRRSKKCDTVGSNLMQSKCSSSDVVDEAQRFGVATASPMPTTKLAGSFFFSLLRLSTGNDFFNRQEVKDKALAEMKEPFVWLHPAVDNGETAAAVGGSGQRSYTSRRVGSNFKQRSKTIAGQAVFVDQFCRIAFPLLFLTFNLFYWISYACA